MRPVYIHLEGPLDDYTVNYTAVLTPHFLGRLEERGFLLGRTKFKRHIAKFWNIAITDKCCGTEFGASYIYFKRKFNEKRKRWELEFITIAPNLYFNTQGNTTATKI